LSGGYSAQKKFFNDAKKLETPKKKKGEKAVGGTGQFIKGKTKVEKRRERCSTRSNEETGRGQNGGCQKKV